MGSFGSNLFIELGDNAGSGYSFASSATGRRVVIPGGSRVVFTRNAAAVHTLETEVQCTAAELDALRAAVGTSAMLTLSRTAGVALLLSVTPAKVFDTGAFVVGLRLRYGGAISGGAEDASGYGNNWGFNWGL